MGLDDDALLCDLTKRADRHAAPIPQFGSLVGARQYSRLYSMVRRHVARGSRVLDWGAGTGHFGYFLTRSGYQATGFEMSSAPGLDWVGQPYVDFATGDLSEPIHLPFPDASFDAVVSVGVLEHVRETGGNELASLAEIRRVTRPGGLFLCYHLPNRTSWIEFIAARIPGKHHHAFRYTGRDIRTMTAQTGWRLLETERYGLLPRNSLRRLPDPLRDSPLLANVWDAFDSMLAIPLGPFCQNFAFVTQRPDCTVEEHQPNPVSPPVSPVGPGPRESPGRAG